MLFYAELSDTWRLADVGEFTRDVVLPLLEGGTALMTMRELRKSLTAWLEAFDEPVQLATDSLAWDWRWIQEFFCPQGAIPAWPPNLLPAPLLLTINDLVDFDEFEPAIERAFAEGLRRHHALDDAKANRIGWLAAGGDIDRAAPPHERHDHNAQ